MTSRLDQQMELRRLIVGKIGLAPQSFTIMTPDVGDSFCFVSDRSQQHIKLDLLLESLATSGRATIRVTGTSMMPVILPNTLLNVCTAQGRCIAAGDVVLIKRADRLQIHRIMKEATHGVFITRGDRHLHDDPAVHRSEIRGIVELCGAGRRRGILRWALQRSNVLARLIDRSMYSRHAV